MLHFPDATDGPGEPLIGPVEVVRSGLCIGCGSCAYSSGGAMGWDRDGFLKPQISGDTSPGQFSSQCPFSSSAASEDEIAKDRFPGPRVKDPRIGQFEAAYVGHAIEDPFRQNGSSGGLTSWVAAELLRTHMVDGIAHVAPVDRGLNGRFFAYRISRSLEELKEGAKSRYYPVDLSSVLREIRDKAGRYAVVGVPCFIKAVHLLRRIDPLVRERVTHTLGLFCGHMKSAAMVESFAWQLREELGRVRSLDYRIKDASRPANWYRAQLELDDGSAAAEDWWNLADGDWGAGFFQNPACDWCDDVVAETADISFGDAWVEPYSSDGRGTNVIVVRSKELAGMIDRAWSEGRLDLTPVDADFIVQTQAAALRHRRDGLAYRLSWTRRGLTPRKRVRASRALPLRRKLVYRLRYSNARWSHRIFRLARTLHARWVYIVWARIALSLYQSVTWSRGGFGKLLDAVLPQPEA